MRGSASPNVGFRRALELSRAERCPPWCLRAVALAGSPRRTFGTVKRATKGATGYR